MKPKVIFKQLRLFIVSLLLIFSSQVKATHYRAGEISYKVLSGTTYEITVTTYTDKSSPADNSTGAITIDWGDGTVSNDVVRSDRFVYNPTMAKNIYIATHTYQDGIYEITVMDRNRVDKILNINGGLTRDLAFCISSRIRVNSFSFVQNSSPILANPPIDKGCKGFVYVHNPMAYDPDGDSLVFRLVPPRMEPGIDVPNYLDPSASDSFRLDSRTGRVYWSKPIEAGVYNIAIEISEYRSSEGGIPFKVGNVTRDMQITIEGCIDSPPVIESQADACTWMGHNYHREFVARDPNPTQNISIIGVSQVFDFVPNAATITPENNSGKSIVAVDFNWVPNCRNIRYEPFWIGVQAKDDYTPSLSDYQGFFLHVIAPSPANITLKQDGNASQKVSWLKDSCGLATKYRVYRRIDSSHWKPDSCLRGIPAYTGFKMIKEIDAAAFPNETFYSDDDKGKGLSPLIPYCYRVVSVYPARSEFGATILGRVAESYTSAEVCGTILRSKPVITRVSINTTDSLMGSIRMNWIRPDTLDTVQYTAPYRLVYRHGTDPNSMSIISQSTYSTFSQIPDSSLIDTLINTRDRQWFYTIDLMAQLNGVEVKVDQAPFASSVRTAIYSTDNTNIVSWKTNVPWTNDSTIVYRQNTSGQFVDIGHTYDQSYADIGLVNHITYCYRVETYGKYNGYPLLIQNFSQQICGMPLDTVKPCPPQLSVTPPCTDYTHFENILTWIPRGGCDEDVVKYRIYFKHQKNEEYELLAELPNTQLTYIDVRDVLKKSIAGCYLITAIDSFDNQSLFTEMVCIDNCPEYRLPNVFTPDGNGVNDLFKPFPYRFIDNINLTIYNRWGEQIFTTTDLDIKWNGKDQKSGEDVAQGIYFYVCDVYEQYLDGLKKRTLKGTVQIIR